MPILLLVGNGVSIDLTRTVVPVAQRLDTTKPLGWRFPVRARDNRDVFDVLAELREAIAFVRNRNPHLTDFETIREVSQISAATPQYAPVVELIRATNGRWVGHLRQHPHFVQHPLDQAGTILRHQLRLFLCAAFVHFYDVHAALDPRDWRWFRWLAQHGDRLGLVCSFNYDLVVEWAFAHASRRGLGYLIDNRSRDRRLLTFKPHGSINFQIAPNAIQIGGNVYENGNIFERNDTPITVLTNDRLHEIAANARHCSTNGVLSYRRLPEHCLRLRSHPGCRWVLRPLRGGRSLLLGARQARAKFHLCCSQTGNNHHHCKPQSRSTTRSCARTQISQDLLG